MTEHQTGSPAPVPTNPPALSPLRPLPNRSSRGAGALQVVTLVVALAAAVMAGIALTRQSSPTAQQPTAPSSPAPTEAEIAAAKQTACNAWTEASAAINSARRPFIESPPSWNDPVTVDTLAQAQAGVLIQVEFLRRQTPPATPREVADPIGDYVAAAIATVAADGQHADAAVANASAERSKSAAAKIRFACGIR